MTAIVSNATGGGDWGQTGTWAGGVVPGDGDTVTLANGDTVTISDSRVVGASPANDTGTPAIQTNTSTGTGKLVMANGSALRFKAPIRMGNTAWDIGSSVTILHDSSGAGTPSTANYSWQIRLGRLNINGAQGARTTFNIQSGSGRAGGFTVAAPAADEGPIIATWTSFAFWGTAAGYFHRAQLITSGLSCTFDNCLWDSCSKISIFDARLGTNVRLKNSAYRTAFASSGVAFEADAAGNGFRTGVVTGDWRLENVYIDGQVSIFNNVANSSSLGMRILNAVITGKTGGVPPLALPGGPTLLEWNNVLLYNQAGSGVPSNGPGGTLTRTILLCINGSTNPHIVAQLKSDATWDGFLAENFENAANASGDLFQTETASAVRTITFRNGLMLPLPNGKAIGAFVNHSTGVAHNGTTQNAPNVTIEHCTWPATDNGSDTEGAGGENNTGKVGIFASVRSNLVWNAASDVGWVTKWQNGTTPVNSSHTNCSFNGYYNVTGERYYRLGTNPLIYATTPGASDVNANPYFVNQTYNFLTWAQYTDPTVTSWADALNRFSIAYNDSGAVDEFTISAAYDWIRSGWAPRNLAFKGTAHDGADIGGVPVALFPQRNFPQFPARRG